MRRPHAAALIAVALLVSACAAAQPPAWTYAPPTASPTAGPSSSAAASSGASAAASAAPSAGASAATSAGPSAGSAAPSAATSAAPSGGSGGGGAASTSLDLTASGVQFDKNALAAPANTAFTIQFNNQDQGIPHNVTIKDASGKDVFKPDLLTGPGKADYNVPALPAGAYTFYCVVHPGMTGTLTVGP